VAGREAVAPDHAGAGDPRCLARVACRGAARAPRRQTRRRAIAGGGRGGRMRFVFRMAMREMRASWKRLLFFFACLSLGVAAIVTLRSVSQSVRAVMMGEARALIAGDVLVTSSRGWNDPDRATLDKALAAEHGLRARTDAIETATMVRPADERKAA